MNSPFDEVMNNVPHTRQSVITLLTDFGSTDGFVGVMKAVMLQVVPDARLIDISHDLPVYSIQSGAFLNQWSYGYFPQNSVHLCVVDPGVGTSRRMLAVEVSGHFFVAPDNGVLSPILRIKEQKTIVSISNARYWMDKVSHTFHGRDIFAPVAAHLAAGVSIDEMGEVIDDPVLLDEPFLHVTPDSIHCQIEYIDRFGNLITTLSDEIAEDWIEENQIDKRTITIVAGDYQIDGIASSYGEKKSGEILAVFDGYNRLEIAVNQGSAHQHTKLGFGGGIILCVKS